MFRKVYNFTNENLNSLNSIYNFDNAKILSVLGSGDQYFTSLLNGASDIELYDINNLTWYYFVLKYYGILILNYDEFYDYFIVNNLDIYECFNCLKKYLPFSVLNKLEYLYSKNKKLSWIFEYSDVNLSYDDGKFIPYLSKDNYYKLQNILRNTNLPNFYYGDFRNLYNKVNNKNYDIIFTSNVFNHIFSIDSVNNLSLYKELLNRYNCFEFQALYCWWLNDDFKDELLKNDFQINSVDSSMKLKLTNDYVISLRK